MSRFQKLPVVSGLGHVTRFITVGALGFAVQIAAFAILTSVGQWPWLPATIVAVELAVVHNFLWHDRWTWRDRSDLPRRTRRTRRVNPEDNRTLPPVLRFLRGGMCRVLEYARGRGDSRFAKFVRFNMTTGLTSIAGNAVLMAVAVEVMRLPGAAANVLAVGAMSVVNFLVSDRWVFQTGAEGVEPVERKGPAFARVNLSELRLGKREGRQEGSLATIEAAHAARAQPPHHPGCQGRKGWLPAASMRNVLAAVIAAMCAASTVQAAPAAATVAAWNRYVAEVEARIERERAALAAQMAPGIDDSRGGQRGAQGSRHDAAVAAGSAVSSSIACEGESISIPWGTISRWRGSLVLRGVTLDQLLHRLQVPGTPPPQEDVAASRVLSRTPDSLRVYIRVVRTALVTVTYDTEHEMRFQRWGPGLATARSVATRVEEIGGDDHGFLWRLNSYWRYRQVTDGVEVDLESLTLSRHVPVIVRPVAAPIVTRIARESMVRTLEALRRYALN
jgi:putative flippase GtrA